MPLRPSDSLTMPSEGGSFDKIMYLQRSIEAAVSTENYERAASCRDEMKTLLEATERERPIESFWFSQIKVLRDVESSVEDKVRSISSLGATGDTSSIIPILASCLYEPQLQEATQTAMWTIWMRPTNKDTRAGDAMKEGSRLMMYEATYPESLAQFAICIQQCPEWAEAYNKRATLYYLMRRWKESIEDCKKTLSLERHHFGAASGMGLCYLNLNEKQQALEAFELAISINPGLSEIRRIVEGLRIELKARNI